MKKRRFSLALILVAAMLLPLTPSAVLPARAVTQAEIDALKSDASGLASQRKDIQKQLKAIQADKSKAQDKKKLLEQQINIIDQEIENLKAQVANYEQLIAEKEGDLAAAQTREREQYELFCKRIRYMEEKGETSYWAILFSSSDFSEMLDNFMMIEEIIQYDNGVMDSLTTLQGLIEEDKTELEGIRAGLKEAQEEQEAAEQELQAQEAEVDKLIKEISGQEAELQAMEEELRKAANAMDAEIKKKERELAEQIAKVVSESGFRWPLDAGKNTLTSLYGPRKDPFTGKAANHTGIDIPAAKGTPIYASKSGMVTTSTLGSGGYWSYGNYVVISHSDGTSTLYAHMNKRNVKEKQVVKQGDVIGYVGTTGRSTGNHLHFEIRKNGVRVDPIDYFPDKVLYYSSKNGTTKLEH